MRIRYIKLGRKGKWEKSCLGADNSIRLGYESPYHVDCVNGNWDPVKQFWINKRKGKDSGAATRDLNQIKDFYQLKKNDVWITFYKRKMYWCHAEEKVTQLSDGSRERKVIGKWKNTDKNGLPLLIENIDGRITQVQQFRGTICKVELPKYVIRKIDGVIQPEVLKAKKSVAQLEGHIEDLISGLWWHDFELLIDLIFSRSGWQRISVLGKTEKDIDLDIFSPTTQKRAFVQVKSKTTASQIEDYYNTYRQYSQYDEMYFIYHSMSGTTSSMILNDRAVHLWDLPQVANLVIHAGVIDWLITKRT